MTFPNSKYKEKYYKCPSRNLRFLQRNKIRLLLNFSETSKVQKQHYQICRLQRGKGDNNLIFFYPQKLSCLGEDDKKVFSDMEEFKKQASRVLFLKRPFGDI